ncbi:hypothetical protein F4779DRAFT_408886 [Xylariaceae sp. FL0662B]|nr:hypothetical protein F4779DRAFT_408886 [Xylariaceae sp. FL0662B]
MNLLHCSHSLRLPRPCSRLPWPRTQLQSSAAAQWAGRGSPPSFRPQFQLGTRRSFHIQPSVEAFMQASQDAILGLHHLTHTPWFLTIPLVAIGIHVVFRLPPQLYQQWILKRRARYSLVMHAWATRIQQDLQREGVPTSHQKREMQNRFSKVEKRLWRASGLQGWKLWSSLLGFPFWILGIDSIRRLCGGPSGLLGSLMTGSDAAEASSSAEASIDGAVGSGSSQASMVMNGDVSAISSTSSTVAEPVTQFVDPSITMGGCLWFPDLSVPDPYHILPLALSALMVGSMLSKPGARKWALGSGPKDDNEVIDTSARRAGLRRGALLLAGLMGPITIGLPAALHLYWLTTSALGWFTYRMLNHLMPLKMKIRERCKYKEIQVIRPRRTDDVTPETGQQSERKGAR